MIHVDALLAQEREDLKGDARAVLQAHQGQTGHVLVLGNAADIGFFHGFDYLLNFGAGVPAEAGQHLQIDIIALCHLDGAVVQHLGAQTGQFQHLVKGDGVQLPGPFHMAGIGSVHAIHIGVDLAQVGVERGGQSHGRGVGAAPAQSGDVVILVDALEAGHQHDLFLVQLGLDTLGIDLAESARSCSGYRCSSPPASR